jgi:peptidoglycan/xylan/chitin deacetylase (PgdA/CDA1 family)
VRSIAMRRSTLAWMALAAAVLGVSVVLTLRNAAAFTPPRIKHFSGSVVVQGLPSVLESPRLARRLRVDILRDDASAGFYDSPATLDSVIAAWQTALNAIGAEVRVVAAQNIGPHPGRVLVIPSSPCLTIGSREAIEAAANDGRGLIFTGLTGNRDIGCRLIGYGFIVTATGAARAEQLESRPMVYAVFPGGGPLADGIPPGSRLELNPGTQVALRGSTRDAFYSDYSLQPAPANGQPLLDAAVSRSTLGDARVVYWGFELRDVAHRPWSEELARLLVRNSVTWAAGEATTSIEAWPKGRRAAAAIAQDVEDDFGNAQLAVDSLEAIGITGSYFLTSRLAKPYTHLSRELAANGEVGSHSENHWVLGGNPDEVQQRRLLETQHDLVGILGAPVRGFRPPEEQFDVATMRDWVAAGGTYLFGANDSRTASPEILALGGDTLVLIGRVGNDDFAAVGQHRDDPRAAAKVFLDDFAQVRALGGAYVLSYHSQLLAQPEWVSVLAEAARGIASDTTVWRTTTGRIAQWWRARAAVTSSVDATRADRVLVTLGNSGPTPIRSLVVHVRGVSSRKPSGADVELLPAPSGDLRLLIPSIAPGATRTYTIVYPSATPARKMATRRPRRHVQHERWSWRRLFPWLR